MGDSMIDAGIYDGDMVLIKPAEQAPNGSIVAALIDGGNTTLRRYYHHNGTVILKPENPSHTPEYYADERVKIQGLLYCLARFYL